MSLASGSASLLPFCLLVVLALFFFFLCLCHPSASFSDGPLRGQPRPPHLHLGLVFLIGPSTFSVSLQVPPSQVLDCPCTATPVPCGSHYPSPFCVVGAA